jgi:hypothetical protein
MMVSEVEQQVLVDVLNFTSELKELIAFSTEEQHDIFLLDLVSLVNNMLYGTYLARCSNLLK